MGGQVAYSNQLRFWSLAHELREAGRCFEVTRFEELPMPVIGVVVSKESATFEDSNSMYSTKTTETWSSLILRRITNFKQEADADQISLWPWLRTSGKRILMIK